MPARLLKPWRKSSLRPKELVCRLAEVGSAPGARQLPPFLPHHLCLLQASLWPFHPQRPTRGTGKELFTPTTAPAHRSEPAACLCTSDTWRNSAWKPTRRVLGESCRLSSLSSAELTQGGRTAAVLGVQGVLPQLCNLWLLLLKSGELPSPGTKKLVNISKSQACPTANPNLTLARAAQFVTGLHMATCIQGRTVSGDAEPPQLQASSGASHPSGLRHKPIHLSFVFLSPVVPAKRMLLYGMHRAPLSPRNPQQLPGKIWGAPGATVSILQDYFPYSRCPSSPVTPDNRELTDLFPSPGFFSNDFFFTISL